jgi:hypothetical protein
MLKELAFAGRMLPPPGPNVAKAISFVNFINILRMIFLYEHSFSSFYVHVTREKLPKQRSYEKQARIMLMKLTAAIG